MNPGNATRLPGARRRRSSTELDGGVDGFVMGVGTGGCFSGVAAALKRHEPVHAVRRDRACDLAQPLGRRRSAGTDWRGSASDSSSPARGSTSRTRSSRSATTTRSRQRWRRWELDNDRCWDVTTLDQNDNGYSEVAWFDLDNDCRWDTKIWNSVGGDALRGVDDLRHERGRPLGGLARRHGSAGGLRGRVLRRQRRRLLRPLDVRAAGGAGHLAPHPPRAGGLTSANATAPAPGPGRPGRDSHVHAALPPPDAPLPRSPAAIVHALAQTDRRLDAALRDWDISLPPPRSVTLLALDEQRIVRLLATRPAAGRGMWWSATRRWRTTSPPSRELRQLRREALARTVRVGPPAPVEPTARVAPRRRSGASASAGSCSPR